MDRPKNSQFQFRAHTSDLRRWKRAARKSGVRSLAKLIAVALDDYLVGTEFAKEVRQ